MSVLSIEPSPSGDMLAAVVGNRRDYELDIVLISARDGAGDPQPDQGLRQGSRLRVHRDDRRPARQPRAVDRLVAGRRAHRLLRAHREVEDADHPERRLRQDRRAHRPEDGRRPGVAVVQPGRPQSGILRRSRTAITDIFTVDLETGEVDERDEGRRSPTTRRRSRPTASRSSTPARVGGNDKLFRSTSATGEKKQLTFGAHDDTAAKFYRRPHAGVHVDGDRSERRASGAEVARNGNIPNVWTLDLNNERAASSDRHGHRQRLAGGDPRRLGRRGLGSSRTTRARTASTSSTATGRSRPWSRTTSASPAPIFDFTPPLSHTLVRDNIHKKGRFEKMSLAGRPPVGLGVTSGGNIYGNTQITFTDVLGDKQISFYAQSISQYRTMAFTLREHRAPAASTRCRASRRTCSITGSTSECHLRSAAGAVHRS